MEDHEHIPAPALETMRHSASHVMADAVRRLFPEVKLAIGPSIEEGFYYDFDTPEKFTPEDLEKIETEMARITAEDLPFEKRMMDRAEALKLFGEKGEKYKVELIEGLTDAEVTTYKHGDFLDLCRGPHVASTGKVGPFKLLSVAGAYWRGDERNAMLQRIYGTAFFTKDDLDAHLRRIEEMKKRDHRRLGKTLELYSMVEDVGPGLVLWHPKGAAVRRVIESFWLREHERHDYEIVYTPHIARIGLWRTSGHVEFYKENMFSPMDVDGQDYLVKPMNCPFHLSIFKSRIRSYRELPVRWAELGTVYRYERSGVMHGLLRVRGFTQDDAHIFVTPEQLNEEISRLLDFTVGILKAFGFSDYGVFLSTRPEKFVGTPEGWEAATAALRGALETSRLPYSVDPGEGVFYGPKIDVKIKDEFGRLWQCSTIQVDFNLPERFEVTFSDRDGTEKRPIMIHRALLGSLERFFGMLIEHYAGAFPLWLAPVQARVLSVNERNAQYGRDVLARLRGAGFRAELDDHNETLGYKVRRSQQDKVPYALVVGDKEEAVKGVAPRARDGKNLGLMELGVFLDKLREEAAVPEVR